MIKRITQSQVRMLLFVIGFILFCNSVSFAQSFISPKEIHEGMVGYGKTVFHGNKIETFKVIALGVLHKEVAGTDVIIVKVESPYLKKRHLSLVSGMSGSPVYFNGKLAGAIALGWPFTLEPVAGVVPIQAMLQSGKRNEGATFSIARLPSHAPATMEPLGIPIAVSGFDEKQLQELKTIFPMAHFTPGGSMMHVKTPPVLQPGQSIGAALMTGDFSLIATGTLTYRDGSRLLAFGHPFLFLGDVQMPLLETYVHYVLPSLELPEKMTSPVEEIGEIVQDRLYGIAGVVGRHASLVPMDISVQDRDRNLIRKFHVKIAHHPSFTAHMASLALEQAIQATAKSAGSATASVDYRVLFENYPPIHIHDMVISDQSIATEVNASLLKPLQAVMNNDFERVRLSKIQVHVSLDQQPKVSTIERIFLNQTHVQPGHPLQVTVVLKPYNQPSFQKTFRIPIPADIRGEVKVGVCGSSDSELRRTMQQALPEPLNVSQIIRQIEEAPAGNELVIRLAYPRKSISLGGEYFRNMPQAYADLLKAAGITPLASHADGAEFRYKMPWIVQGSELSKAIVGEKEQAGNDSESELSLPSSEKQNFNPMVLARVKDWKEGRSHGLAISPEGNLFLAPSTEKVMPIEENFLWSETHFEKNVYIGTANPGKVYRIRNSDSSPSVFFDPKAMAVTALLSLSNGDLLLGTTGGELFHLDSSGGVKSFWQLKDNYIWSMILCPRYPEGAPRPKDLVADRILIASGGSEGKIYQLDMSAKSPHPVLFYTSPDSHILSLYAFPDGRIFAGTANQGLLVQLDSSGHATPIQDLNEQAILSLAGDVAGNLFVGVSGSSKIYRLTPSGEFGNFSSLSGENVTLLAFQGDKLLAGTGVPASLYSINSDGQVSSVWRGRSSDAVSLKGDQNGDWFSISGPHGRAFQLGPNVAPKGEFLSKVFDMGAKAVWGRLQWFGDVPDKTQILVQTRSGNTPVPDSSWSAWSSAYPSPGWAITDPSSRYLQCRISLIANALNQTPRLEAVKFFWRTAPVWPKLSISFPQNGDVIGPKSQIKGDITAAGAVSAKLVVNRQSGKESEKIFEKWVTTSEDKHDQDLTIPLDSIHKEGPLSLIFTLTNPEMDEFQSLNSQVLIKDLVYDSSSPQITGLRGALNGKWLKVEGVAGDSTSYIKEVQFRLASDKPWINALSSKGLFDSATEPFHFTLENSDQIKDIEVRALDAADNETTVKKSISELLKP